MSQQEAFYQWIQEVASRFPTLGAWQVKGLAEFSWACAQAESCQQAQVAQQLPTDATPRSEERRYERWLANPGIDWRYAIFSWCAWILNEAVYPTSRRLSLLVDATHPERNLTAMVVRLAYYGRAIPLAWWCFPHDSWPMDQVTLILTLLNSVKTAVPEGVSVLVEADRGIGTSPNLLRGIEAMGWHYLVRVQRTTRLRLADGRELPFEEYLRTGQLGENERVYAFKKADWMACHAVTYWEEGHEEGHKEAWMLLTNLPNAHGKFYALRMWQELAFRDLKSGGFQWHQSRLRGPERANRLWLWLWRTRGF